MRVNAAAFTAYPRMIQPDDDEMREVCDSLVERASLTPVREGIDGALDPETDAVAGYVASEELRAAMLMRAAMN